MKIRKSYPGVELMEDRSLPYNLEKPQLYPELDAILFEKGPLPKSLTGAPEGSTFAAVVDGVLAKDASASQIKAVKSIVLESTKKAIAGAASVCTEPNPCKIYSAALSTSEQVVASMPPSERGTLASAICSCNIGKPTDNSSKTVEGASNLAIAAAGVCALLAETGCPLIAIAGRSVATLVAAAGTIGSTANGLAGTYGALEDYFGDHSAELAQAIGSSDDQADAKRRVAAEGNRAATSVALTAASFAGGTGVGTGTKVAESVAEKAVESRAAAEAAGTLKTTDKSLRGISDAELGESRIAGGYITPQSAVSTVDNAWLKVLRYEKINNNGQPLSQAEREKLFDSFLSHNLTQFGDARAARNEGNKLFLLDDPFLADDKNIPDYIKKRVTIDHHDGLFTTEKGAVDNTGQQIAARAQAGDQRVLNTSGGKVYYTSGNIYDGSADAGLILQNATKIAENPQQAKTVAAISDWIDNKTFSKQADLLTADVSRGSELEKVLATQYNLDQTVAQTGTKAADRTAIQAGSEIVNKADPDRVRYAIASAQSKLKKIFFGDPNNPLVQNAITSAAQKQIQSIREVMAGIDRGRKDLGSYYGKPSGILFYDAAKSPPAAKKAGLLARWRALPEKAKQLEATTPGLKVTRSVNTDMVGKDGIGPIRNYFIGTLEPHMPSLQGIIPALTQAEREVRVKLLEKVIDPAEKLTLKNEIAAIDSGKFVQSRGDGLVFVPAGSRLSPEELEAVMRQPEVQKIMEGR